MKKLFSKIIFSFFLTSLLLSCANNTEEVEAVEVIEEQKESAFSNLYEYSEMAQLMEDMYDEMEALRLKIVEEEGEIGEYPDYFKMIRTAEMTKDFRHDNIFKQFAESYLASTDILYHNVEDLPSKEQFNIVVNSCITCHTSEVGCFGPVSRIKKLVID